MLLKRPAASAAVASQGFVVPAEASIRDAGTEARALLWPGFELGEPGAGEKECAQKAPQPDPKSFSPYANHTPPDL